MASNWFTRFLNDAKLYYSVGWAYVASSGESLNEGDFGPLTMDNTGALRVNATVNASIAPFEPNGSTQTLAVSSVSSNVALPSGTACIVENTGTTTAYFTLGSNTVTATTSGIYVPGGAAICVAVGTNTYIAGITSSGTTNFNLIGGDGIFSGFAQGSGGSGTNVNVSQVGGTAVDVNAGNASAGTQRVVLASNQPAVAVSGTFWQATQPISAASLPLPTGAATAAKQPALGIAGTPSADVITVQGAASMTAIAVSGTFWQTTQPISAASLPLPTGAATAAKQPALGTAGSASADVISVQGITSMTPLKVDGSAVTQPVSGTFWQATQPVSGTVTANAGTNLNTSLLALESGGNLATLAGGVSAGKYQVNVTNASLAVTGTFWQATQPVSGTFWQATQPVSIAAAVTVQGDAASGSSVAGNPVLAGARAATAQPTSVADGQAVDLMADVRGALVVVQNAPRALKGVATASATDATSHTLISAGAAGVFNDIEAVWFSNTSASATNVTLSDGTNSFVFAVPAGDVRGLSVPGLLNATSSATAWTYQASTGVSTLYAMATYTARKG